MFNLSFDNILNADVEVLVNTVNCVGVMGKGIAKEFKDKYPDMYKDYTERCSQKQVYPGEPYIFSVGKEKKVINFPTKEHWRSPSKLEYIEKGLDWFVNNYKQLNIKSVAFPPLGCGNGGLSWDNVGPLMYKKLNELPIKIVVYPPIGTQKNKLTKDFFERTNNLVLTNSNRKKFNVNWLLSLQIVKMLNALPYNAKVGRIMFQKICYILGRNGTQLGLSYVEGKYGPYSKDIYNMITILSNNNLIHEKSDKNAILIEITKDFIFDERLYNKKDLENMKKTYNLFKKIQNAKQAELITTIIFAFDSLNSIYKDNVDDERIINRILNWKKRYNNDYQISQIKELLLSLTDMKLIDIKFNNIDEINFNLD